MHTKYLIISLSSLVLLVSPIAGRADLDTANHAYEQGDYSTAFKEFTRLAQAGNATAQHNLAFMYYGGEGIPRDYGQAFYWFEKAAKSGYASAQDILAYMYNHGYGVKADRIRAYVWYSLAADNGVFLAAKVRDRLAHEMGEAERAQAQLLTREYLKKYTNESSRD